MLPAQPNQSLIDGLACLQQLASQAEPVGGRELARELGLEPTRVNRLLRTLAHLGLAQQDDKRKYRTGPGIHVLAAQAMFGSGLLRRALPVLEQLRHHRHTVALGVLWRDRVAYLYHASPGTPPGEALGRVGLYPALRSGIGLALLAQLDAPRLREQLGGRVPRNTASSLKHVRTQGYALVEQEQPGHRSLGVGLRPHHGAAIAASGTFADQDIPTLAAALSAAAQRIEEPLP